MSNEENGVEEEERGERKMKERERRARRGDTEVRGINKRTNE